MEVSLSELIWQVALAIAGILMILVTVRMWDYAIRWEERVRVYLSIVLTFITGVVWYACYLCMVKYGVL